MMLERIFLVSAFVGLVVALMDVIGADIYDTREARKRRQLKAHPYARRYRQRPLISVIVATHNDARRIERCLASLLRSSYRKLEIIVVDGASGDDTKSLVRKFIAENPHRAIRLVARRTPRSSLAMLTASYKQYGNGELVMLCDVGNQLDKRTFTNAVKHFNTEQNIDALHLNCSVRSAFSTVGLFQRYESLVRYRSKKFASVSNSDYGAPSEAAIYRREVFLALRRAPRGTLPGNKQSRAYFADDAVVYVEPLPFFYALLKQRYHLQLGRLQALRAQRRLFFTRDQGYTKFLTWFRLPFAVCAGLTALFVPLLLSYFIYLAVGLHEPALFITSWAILGLSLLLAVWGDEHLKWRQKVAYSVGIPITYALFYLLSFVQIFVIARGILPRKLKSAQ